MRNFFIGLLIGIGKILPGVSGSLIAIRFNVYEKMIDSIINYFSNIKKNTIFLGTIFIGILISIVLSSNLVLYCLNNYRIITITIFIILIASGIPEIVKKGNNLFIAFFTFCLSLLLLKLPTSNINIGYFPMGIIEAISMIIPGISGTAIYMSFGVYEKMLNLFIVLNFKNLFFFFLGFLFSSIFVIKLINYLFKKHKKETYSAILGFLLASIILMVN